MFAGSSAQTHDFSDRLLCFRTFLQDLAAFHQTVGLVFFTHLSSFGVARLNTYCIQEFPMFFTKCRCFQHCQESNPEENSVFFGCRRLKFEGTLTLKISRLPQHTKISEIASEAVLIQ